MNKLPYIIWAIYALILLGLIHVGFREFTGFTEESLDEMTGKGMEVAMFIAAIAPVFFRPIHEHLLRNIGLYIALGFLYIIIFRFTIMPLGVVEDEKQQMLRFCCIVFSAILPIVTLHFVNKKLNTSKDS